MLIIVSVIDGFSPERVRPEVEALDLSCPRCGRFIFAGHACDERVPAFDTEVLDIYLRMPPAWRCSGRMVQLALRELSPEIARLPNANTHFPADLNPRLEVACVLARAAFRRLGLARRPAIPTAMHSAGSWQDLSALLREDPEHRDRLIQIKGRLDSLCLSLLDPDRLARCIDDHLAGNATHTKLLRQLLTHDSWMRGFGIFSFFWRNRSRKIYNTIIFRLSNRNESRFFFN